MSDPVSIPGDLYVAGRVNAANGISLRAGDVNNASVGSSPSDPIDTPKVSHLLREMYQAATTATVAATLTQTLHVVRNAGMIKRVGFAAITPAVGAATLTIDIKKNGATVLTGTFQLTSAQTARQLVSGVLIGGAVAVADGDEISVVMTATAGGGTLPSGVYGYVDIHEAAAA